MARPIITRSAWMLLTLALASPGFAQTEDDDLDAIESIVVTITKREESLVEVAATISAFGDEAIKNSDIQSISDVVNLIPNVQIKGDGNAGVSIRGVSQSFTSQAPVAMHLNGIWRQDAGNSFLGTFYDLQSIQVQRGPVGTVYGRNATAGAMDVSWKKPSADYEAGGDAAIGSHSLYQFRGYANVPFLGEGDERLMGRFVFQRETRDNYTDLLNQRSGLGGSDLWYLRGSVRSVITEDLEVTVRGSWARDREGEAVQSKPMTVNGQFAEGLFDLGPLGAHPFDPLNGYQNFYQSLVNHPVTGGVFIAAIQAGNPALTPAQAAEQLISQGFGAIVPPIAPAIDSSLPIVSSDGQKASNSSFRQVDPHSKTSSIDMEILWSINDLPLLGDVQMKAIGGWDRWGMTQTPEADGTDLVILDTQSDQQRRTWVGEVNLTSQSDGPVEWIAGFFYFDSEHETTNGTLTPFALPPLERSHTTSNSKGYAPFAQAAIRPLALLSDDPTLDFQLWAGVRYNHDEIDVSTFNPSPLILADMNSPRASQDTTFREVTYEFGLRWFVNEDHMVYAKWSKGYKPGFAEAIFDRGTVSGNSAVSINPVEPEIIRSWETGWKATWWDGRAQTALTYFHYSYTDLQVPKIVQGRVETENAAAATNQGAELEVRLQPTEAWSIQLAAGWLDATFDDFCSNDELDFNPGSDSDPACLGEFGPLVAPNMTNRFQDLSGFDLEDSPTYKASLVSSYEIDLGELGSLTPVVQFTWTDDYFRRSFNRNDYDKVDAYTRTDFRLFWRSIDRRYGVELFVQNIEDETVYARTIAVEIPTAAVAFGLLPPRVYGIRFSYEWGGL